MKNLLSLMLIISICGNSVYAQMSSPIRIKAGEDLYQKMAKEIYLYPAFMTGNILFRDGKTNEAKFNYNMLNGDIQFINDKGDTMSLANELTIKYVSIAKDSFFYSDGYLQLIAGNESAKVAKKQVIKIMDRQKIGAYDQPSSAGAITSINSLSSDRKRFNLDIRQDVILAKQVTLYIGDKYNHFFRASKKNLLKNYATNEKELTEYFKNNDVNFYNEKDLTRLVAILKD